MQRFLDELRRKDARPLFLTGAGISVASGIPTFRGPDPDAIWANDVTELGTNSFFLRHPEKSWAWYLDRFAKCRGAEPNAAHHSLAALEKTIPGTRVVTQNIDGLHHRAGQKNLIEVHGAARKMRCSHRFCKNGAPKGFLDWDDTVFEPLRAEVKRENVPKCPECGKFLRAHVLWFDETYTSHMDYQVNRAWDWFDDMTALICIGTSFSVTITDLALQAAGFDKPVFVIDPHADPLDESHIHYKEPAEEFLPRLLGAL
jgi:NAD-dependent deacetylase